MDNDNLITHLENFGKKRKDLLFRKDLESMQKEFLENKEKTSVKLTKREQHPNQPRINDPLNVNVNTIKTTKIKGKKKVKDVIALDIPISGKFNEQLEIKSLFRENIAENNKLSTLQAIDKESGLPPVFKLKKEGSLKVNKEITIEKNVNEKQEQIKEIKDEYNKINNENLEKIKKMSKEEFDAAQKEILTSIPSNFIEKMKKGFYSKKLKKTSKNIKSLNESQTKNPSDSISLVDEIILYDYNGNTKIQKISKETKEDSFISFKNKIDFSKLTFNEIDLEHKFFSLSELYNLLSSSNPIQISFSLKVLFNLLSKRLFEVSNDFQSQLYSFINAFYFLTDHSNINISLFALKNFVILLQHFFYDDYKKFSFLINNVSIFQAFNISHTSRNLSTDLYETKMKLIELLKQNNKNYLQLIIYSNNEEIKNLYREILFYVCYISNSIPGDLIKHVSTINQEIQIEKKQKLCKLVLLLSPANENLNVIKNYIKNKHYCNFICALRGIQINDTQLELDSLQNKNYNLNYILLSKKNTNIPISLYIHETDSSYLSKVLLCKLKFALNTDNFTSGDDISPMFTNETQINFFTNKFNEVISQLSTVDFTNYFELIPLYCYINAYLLFWHKSFKYPKIISYKNTGVSLNMIISLYQTLHSHLVMIINDCNLIKNKTEKREKLYQYQIFLLLNINYIKCFIKNHESTFDIKGFPLYLISLSELINKGDEYYYFIYTKFLKNILLRKFNKVKTIEKDISNFDIELFYKEIETDLNFYLDSNENYRKSILDKKIFMLAKNNHTIPIIVYNETLSTNKSKYFPFEQNFIFQILYNDKAQISIKINYLIILFFLCYNEDYFNDINKDKVIITPFEICLRFILNSKLSDFVINEKLAFYFNLFIKRIVLNSNNNIINISIYKTLSNKILLENVFALYEEILNYEHKSILLKLIILFILFLHNNNLSTNMINPEKYSKNIEQIIYENFNLLTEDSFLTDGFDADIVLTNTLNNLSISNVNIYQTLILCFIKFNKHLHNGRQNIILLFIQKLIEYFNIQLNDYDDYILHNEKLINIMLNKLKTK